jgi:DNA-directed RNA polymerase subunit RPC12/RpoP
MTFLLSCECGKKLRAKDEWRGTRVKCPACGEVILIPGKPAVSADSRTPALSRDSRAPAVSGDSRTPARQSAKTPVKAASPNEDDSDLDTPRPGKRKRKKSKKRFRFGVPEIDILGIHMTLTKWIVFICIGTLLGGGIWALLPNYDPKVVEARWVDVFGALDVRNPVSGNPLTRPRSLGLIPGGDQFLIVHDNPEGSAVQIRLKVPPKFRTRHHDAAQAGTFMLQSGAFLLQGDGPPTKPFYLELEKQFPDGDRGVTVDFSESGSAEPVIPRHRTPWNQAGDLVTDTFKVEIIKPKPRDILDTRGMNNMGALAQSREEQPRVSITGTGDFHGKRGMEVHYDFQGSFVTVTWDKDSRAHVGGQYQEFMDSWFDVWEMVLIFPRPSGQELTLTAMGDRVGRVRPR